MGHLIFSEKFWLGLIALGAWLIQKIAVARKNAATRRDGGTPTAGAHGQAAGSAGRAAQVDDEQARTRRVKAEVARKIAQRKLAERQILMMPSARTDPSPRPVAASAPEDFLGSEIAAKSFAPAAPYLAPLPLGPSMPALAEAAGAAAPAANWLDDLRETSTARRAILYQEILGRPVGLR
jgi:hypothetical protein